MSIATVDRRQHPRQAVHRPAPFLMKRDPSYAASIVETIRQPLVVLDADLRVRSANRSFYQTLQVVAEESEGRLLYELGEREWDVPQLRELLERILPQRSEVRDYEVTQRFPSIGCRTMLLNARRLRLQGGRSPLILLAVEDITDRKRADEARQLFLAATSHDVLNALSSIAGYAQLLTEEGVAEPPLAPRIISLAGAVSEIMRDLLDHGQAGTDRPKFAVVSARALIRTCTQAAEWPCKQKGLGFRVDLPAEGEITTDPSKVARVLNNLLSNAVRYTPSGEVYLQGELASNNLRVSVRDTGIGIPAADIHRVFEPYYRSPTAQQIETLGSGLGLSTVKRFCDLLGGTTQIESTPGVGTICTILLPRHPPSP
jgi:PAS domain S-box-containing protein